MRLLLAIELSQRSGSIALGSLDGGEPTVGTFPVGGAHHDDGLMPSIDRLVRDAGATPGDLGAVAVSVGPGGFTGLRVATTTAKLLAEVLAIPCVAIPSSLVIAARSTSTAPKLVALAAKRDTCWLTKVRGTGAHCDVDGEPGIVAASAFEPGAARELFADEHAPPALIDRARAAGLAIHPLEPSARECWLLGALRVSRRETCDPLHLAPLYPREPEAVTLWRERHGDRPA